MADDSIPPTLGAKMSGRIKAGLVLLWIAVTLPLATLGYGSDGDSWLIARAAETMWRTGEYVASRTTGFPLYEIAVTPLVHAGGWFLSNGLSIASGIALLCALFRLADRRELRHPILTTLAMNFLPVVVTAGSSTMDYVTALAILLWSYVMLCEERASLSAVLIGVACGFRPTSGLFAVPAAAMLARARGRLAPAVVFIAVASAVGALAYAPALITYGLRRVYPSITLEWQTRALIGGYSALQLLGIVPSVVVGWVLVAGIWRARHSNPQELRSPFVVFHAVNLAVWMALFVAMPYETGYLIPMVPSIILLLDRWLPGRAMAGICILLLSNHVIAFDLLGGESGRRFVKASIGRGHTIADTQDRLFKLSTREAAARLIVRQPTVLMFGQPWIPHASPSWGKDKDVGGYRRPDGQLFVTTPIMDEAKLRELKRRGFRLVIWGGEKWEYERGARFPWRDYVEVVDDMGDFFGSPIRGRGLMDR